MSISIVLFDQQSFLESNWAIQFPRWLIATDVLTCCSSFFIHRTDARCKLPIIRRWLYKCARVGSTSQWHVATTTWIWCDTTTNSIKNRYRSTILLWMTITGPSAFNSCWHNGTIKGANHRRWTSESDHLPAWTNVLLLESGDIAEWQTAIQRSSLFVKKEINKYKNIR